MTLAMRDRAGEERRPSCSLSHFCRLCFLLPPPPSQQLLSTTASSSFPSFIHALCPIISNTFPYPHSPAEHLKGRGGTRASASSSSGATAAVHGCNRCGLAWWAQPSRRGRSRGGHTLVKGQCSLGGTVESSARHCSGAGPCGCGPVNSAAQPVLCGVILALPPSVFAPLGNPSRGPGLHCARCHPNTKRTALASAGAIPRPHQNTF